MDRELPEESKKQQSRRRWLWIAVGTSGIVLAVWLLRNSFGNSINQKDVRLATAEVGDVENTLTASGEVQPDFEAVITSPITAVIQQTYLEPGASVKVGDKILELDKEFTQLSFDKQKDQLELKRNGIVKLRWELDKSVYDLKINDSIKGLKINSFRAEVENAKRLFRAGGGTREAIEQAEQTLRIAQLEKRQLENDIRIKQQTVKADIKESEIEAQIQAKDLQELQRKLQQANITANRSGVLTYVNKNIGSKVAEGEVLARLADLSGFKIIGAISDNYAEQIRIGMGVVVRVNETLLRGTLTNISPSVQNNIVNFDIQLDEKGHKLLRPKMKVEVFPITDAHSKVVRVTNGAGFTGVPVQDVFVLRNDGKAERRTVKVGLANFDYVEILEGIKAGEKVIISDMSKFKNAKEVELIP
ncbi:efflux RND transporter periplasmic adaptor subunit [Runella sp. SP2]|uniref:efflux RND transporter periplasmic adaptor subunit n=1 Tax=Runella sp. SP2 TaxID=2268026 RepID=UPI000F095EA9|nr:HlyD family efflux transporter periplasmic adaptor subunit [Runella sp. SP2]AYQ35414.1 HlyD family efflux transporter periplasmic adaptor subunit [Runella sp. SP2]